MSLSRGIDVSHFQGTVDWQALKATHGLTWGAAKASEGTTFVDTYFVANWARMKAAGLTRMAYHYGHPAQSAVDQARLLVHLADPQPGDVLCLDLETGDGYSQAAVNAWARTFGTTLRAEAPGITTVLYAGSGYALTDTGRGLSAFFDYWWYPRYATTSPVTVWPTTMQAVGANTTGWPAPHLWQWAESLRSSWGALDASVGIPATQLATPTGTPTPEVDPMAGITIAQIVGGVWNVKTTIGTALGAPEGGEGMAVTFKRLINATASNKAQLAAQQAQIAALTAKVDALPDTVVHGIADGTIKITVDVNTPAEAAQ